MKIHMILPAAILAVLTSIALTGCSSKPIDELEMVGAAMEQARNVEASEYAPLDWDRARLQWEEANALIHMGRYGEARDVLVEAVASYNMARDKANRRVESLKIEIAALQSSVGTEFKKIEKDSESTRIRAYVKKRIEAALPRIDEKIATMNAAFEAKEYLRSRMAGQEAMRYIQDLRTRLGITQ